MVLPLKAPKSSKTLWFFHVAKPYFPPNLPKSQKKHYGFLNALIDETPKAISSLFKILIYFFFNKTKKEIHKNKFNGFFYSMLGKPSTFRPKIDLDNLNN